MRLFVDLLTRTVLLSHKDKVVGIVVAQVLECMVHLPGEQLHCSTFGSRGLKIKNNFNKKHFFDKLSTRLTQQGNDSTRISQNKILTG